jgi:hypothetical protein
MGRDEGNGTVMDNIKIQNWKCSENTGEDAEEQRTSTNKNLNGIHKSPYGKRLFINHQHPLHQKEGQPHSTDDSGSVNKEQEKKAEQKFYNVTADVGRPSCNAARL